MIFHPRVNGIVYPSRCNTAGIDGAQRRKPFPPRPPEHNRFTATPIDHASQGLKVGLYTPTILGGNSYLSWFYDRGAIKERTHTGTSKGLSEAINRGPIKKFLPKYANVYVTIQSHGLSAGVRTHYVTANGVRDGLPRQWP